MRAILPAILLAFLIATLSTCKKYVGDYDSNYIGEWHSEAFETPSGQREIYIRIDGKNSEYGFLCEINCNSCICQELTTGKAFINKKRNILAIGGFNKKTFKLNIEKHPYQNTAGNWEFVIKLDGADPVIMHKQ